MYAEFSSFGPLEEILKPFLERIPLEQQENFWADIEKLHAMKKSDNNTSIRRWCDLSDETFLFLYGNAEQLMAEKKIDEAKVILKYLLLLDDTLAEVWHQLGVCLKEQSSLEEALDAFKTASQLNPTLIEPKVLILESTFQLRKFKEASVALQDLEHLLVNHRS
jgi:tetratricopeptide (TPR) repeat protein